MMYDKDRYKARIDSIWYAPDSDQVFNALEKGGFDDPAAVIDRLNYAVDDDPNFVHTDFVVDYIAEHGIEDEDKREHLEKIINAIIAHSKERKNVELLCNYLLDQLNDLIIL